MRIDADAHVDETEATWEYMEESEARYLPVSIDPGVPVNPGDSRVHRMWLIDGHFELRHSRDDARTGTSEAMRTLQDVEGRVAHMDELRIDVQVLYPTRMLSEVTERPEIELALTRSYNRWMADRTALSKGRLRWIAVLPMLSMHEACEEMRWCRDHGAVGVLKRASGVGGVPVGGRQLLRGSEVSQRSVADAYFFPVYETAQELDIPICIHGAGGAVTSFTTVVQRKTPERFPQLRWGWIESSSSWVPYACADLRAKIERGLTAPPSATNRPLEYQFDIRRDLFREYRLYVACETQDDLPYILTYGTEDYLMVGTDYSHSDQASQIEALDIIEARGKEGEIPFEVAQKILEVNPRRFYGL